jgi:serine/threonine protein kinase
VAAVLYEANPQTCVPVLPQVLAHLKHPYIIGYMTYFIVGSHLNIVLEYAAGGDLSHRIKRQKDIGSPFPEDDILVWFAQVRLLNAEPSVLFVLLGMHGRS